MLAWGTHPWLGGANEILSNCVVDMGPAISKGSDVSDLWKTGKTLIILVRLGMEELSSVLVFPND